MNPNKPLMKYLPKYQTLMTIPYTLYPKRFEGGFIALISLLIVLAVTSAIGLSLSLLSINELKMSFEQDRSIKSFYAAEACLEESLLRLKKNPAYAGGSLSIDGNNCIITVSADGDARTITASSSANNFIRKIRAEATLTSGYQTQGIILNDWEEIVE